MELSRIAQQYAPALSREERRLVATLPGAPAPVTAARYERQMKELADARAFMKQVPDKKSADRQDKAEKIRMLKERLRMLKQMIPFMSPAAAKSLKAELRQIAAQLSALAADGSGGRDGTGASPAGTAGGLDSMHTAVPETAGAEEETATGTEGPSADGTGTKREEAAGSDRAEAAGAAAGNRQMQEEMEELKRLYRSVRAMVQRKLQQAGDRGEPLPNGPAPLTAYLLLPETGTGITLRA